MINKYESNDTHQQFRMGGTPAWRGAHMLIAEDDDDLRTLLANAFRRQGYVVEEVRDGGELLDRIVDSLLYPVAAIHPEIVVADIRMPGCSGLEVLTGLRRAEWDTPFILITGFGDDELQEKALQVGADAVFYKPFDVDELCKAAMRLVPPEALSDYGYRLIAPRHELHRSFFPQETYAPPHAHHGVRYRPRC